MGQEHILGNLRGGCFAVCPTPASSVRHRWQRAKPQDVIAQDARDTRRMPRHVVH